MLPSIINLELFGQVSIYFGLGVQIVTAFLLGGLIGWDRERKMKSAGIKTNILICMGSTIYTSISMLNHSLEGITDPNRMAAQIVSGIGFLGAGAIIHGKGSVSGLTTAATIWVVAAIGVTIGSGYPFTATIFTTTILGVLMAINPFYKLFSKTRLYHVEVLTIGSARDEVYSAVKDEFTQIHDFYEENIDDEGRTRIIHTYVHGNTKNISKINEVLSTSLQVTKINCRELDEDWSSDSEDEG